jgi:branched-chain amino acid transport system substrate-binding protein
MLKMLRRIVPAVVAAIVAASPAMADEQYFGIPSSRVGPYSAMGTGYYGGIIDYLNYVNMKEGGVNGVKLT